MNFFGTKNKPVIKTKTVSVTVPAKRIVRPAAAPSRPSPLPKRPSQLSTPRDRLSVPSEPKERVRRVVKRKASTPTQVFSDDDDDDSGIESSTSSLDTRKRIKSRATSEDPNRKLEDTRLRKDEGRFEYLSGASLVAGEFGKSYKSVFPGDSPTVVKLQYPGQSIPEKFTLVKNGVQQDYQPLDDIRETVKFICQNYFPEDLAKEYLDDEHGFERRLLRAASKGSKEDYVGTIQDFNTMILKAKRDGTISKELSTKHSLTLEWIQRILDQIYTRTVSPQVDSLKAYQNGTDNVYGELLPPLVSEMLNGAELKSDQVFVDLGSGVGNVCLQASLETGCESWGCEVMENPCKLADLQAKEFPARARMWGLSVGKVHLLKGDFLANQKIGEVLKRADVVLVNNQAFSPDLNSKIMDRFLDLKDGCRIISLKPFKQEGYEISDRNQHDPRHLLVDERKLPFYSKCVSWTDAPGEYHIVRKSHERLKQFSDDNNRRTRRS
ncbi:DOT1-domain-containing protein [Aureobasidium subglaciale]|nr:DOT1-domain-containing protein [Aureobasidium subglaciale]